MSYKYNILEDYKEQEAKLIEEFSGAPLGNNPNKFIGQYIPPYNPSSAPTDENFNIEDKHLLWGALAQSRDDDFINGAKDYYGDEAVVQAQEGWKQVKEDKITPYNIKPYPFTIEDDLPILKKSIETLKEEREAEQKILNSMTAEDRDLYEMGKQGSVTTAEIDAAVNRPFFLGLIEKTAAFGVNPLSQVVLPKPEQGTEFYSKRATLPRDPTVEQAEFLGKQYGLNGTYRYLDPNVPSSGITYQEEGSDERVMWDSPFVDARDIGEGIITEGPAAIGDAITTIFGAKGAGRVLKKAEQANIPILRSLAKFKGLEPLFNNKTSPGLIGRTLQKLGLSGFSAAGAATGDFTRIWAGKVIGAHDMDMTDMLKESGVTGLWAMGGTFVISSTADIFMKIMRLTTGDVPPEFLQALKEALDQAEAGKQGVKGPSPESVAGVEPTIKEINASIDALAEKAGDDFLKIKKGTYVNKDGVLEYNPTIAQAGQSEATADLQHLFLEMASDPTTAAWFKEMIDGNKELERRFFKGLNKYIGPQLSELTQNVIGAELTPLIREAAEQRKKDYEAAAREAFEEIRVALDSGDEQAAFAAGEALLKQVETRGGIYSTSSSRLDQIKQQHIKEAAEAFRAVLQDPKYADLQSGSGYIGKAAREWSQGISDKSESVLKHIDTAGVRDDFWQMLGPEGKALLYKLEGYGNRPLLGTKANIKRLEKEGVIPKGYNVGEPLFTKNNTALIERAGKKGRPNFTLTELNDTRVMLNDYISQSNSNQGTKVATALRDSIGQQVDRTVIEGAAGEVGKRNGLTGEALEQFIKTNSRGKGPKVVREFMVETGYGDDIAEAFTDQVRAYKETKTKIIKTLLDPNSDIPPERVIQTILNTGTPDSPINSTMLDFVKVLKNSGDDELFSLQQGLAQHIKNKFKIGLADKTGKDTAISYQQFIKENEGTLRAVFGDDFSKSFLLGGEKAFQKQVLDKIGEKQILIDNIAASFGLKGGAGLEDVITNILNAPQTKKETGQIILDVENLIDVVKNSPELKFQIGVVTKRWLANKFTKSLKGTGNEFKIDAAALDEVIRAFGPEDISGQRLTFENFIEPLIGEEGKTYVKYLKEFNSLVQRNVGPDISKYAAGEVKRQAGEGLLSVIKDRALLQRLFFSPLTIASRRVTALSNRINNRSREYVAEMLLNPKMLKRTMDYANGRVTTQNFIRYLASLDSVAAHDLGNQLELYNSVYQKTDKEKVDLSLIDYESRLAPDFNPITTAIGAGAGTAELLSSLAGGAYNYGAEALAEGTGANRIAELSSEIDELINNPQGGN